MLALVDTVPTSCVFVCDAFYDTLNDDYVFDSYEPVVEAAIAWYVSSNNES